MFSKIISLISKEEKLLINDEVPKGSFKTT